MGGKDDRVDAPFQRSRTESACASQKLLRPGFCLQVFCKGRASDWSPVAMGRAHVTNGSLLASPGDHLGQKFITATKAKAKGRMVEEICR